jgi:hypothetical protein
VHENLFFYLLGLVLTYLFDWIAIFSYVNFFGHPFYSLLVFVLVALCWTKSFLCNVAAFTGMPFISEFISLIWKEPFMTKFECHKLQEGYFSVQGYFEYPRKILCRFQLREIRSHDFVQTTQSKRPDAHHSATYVRTRWQYHPDSHQCLQTLNCSRLHPSGLNGKSSCCYLEFEKILAFHCIRPEDVIFYPNAQLSNHHLSGRRELSIQTFPCVEKLQIALACIRPDDSAARLTPSSVRSAMGSLSKTQIWEDSCSRLNDVFSRPDALIHKASRAFKIQMSGR